MIFDNLIIGAGISGLTLGIGLQQQGRKFIILEKSKGVGGRLATRRDELSTYDHGAQFVKALKGTSFAVDKIWTNSGLKHLWFSDSNHDYFCSQKGMTSLAKELAEDLPIQLSEKIMQIKRQGSSWQLICESGQVYEGKSIFLTLPVPQSLELLAHSNLEFPEELLEITYAKALVGLFEMVNNQDLKTLAYSQSCGEFIFSVANQQSKKISENLAFTVVMKHDYSKHHFLSAEAEVLQDMTNHFKKYLKVSAVIKKSQLKKWRYSHPQKIAKTHFLKLTKYQGIFLLGDGFGGPHVHGACKSAAAVLAYLSAEKD